MLEVYIVLVVLLWFLLFGCTYITVVVVVISFSIIVSCMFIPLLYVTLGIIYNTAVSIEAIKGILGGSLRYKPEDGGFDSRWCHWNFSLI